MLRILLFLICIYILYKVLTFSKKDPKSKKSRFRVVYPPPSSSSQSLVVDEMKRCPSCGTFNPKSHALEFHGEYFCNAECKGKRV